VARCPHLGLEEPGRSPFPFPSPSHHCYVSLPGFTIGQREQRRYCLTRRHTTCPLFPSPPLEETRLAAAPEPTWLRTDMEEVELSLPQEPLVAPEVQERSVDIPIAVRPPETAPEPVRRAAAKEQAKPPIEREMVAEHLPHTGVEAEETRLVEEPALDAAPEITGKTAPRLRRALPWAAAGLAAVALPCIGALVALYVAGPISGISLTTLQLPSLCPGSLLLVSGASFAGAGLLLGLLLWARRRQSM
jgi:hypothetical protein